MARIATVMLSALNIKVHPHSPEHYMRLLLAAAARKRFVQVHGSSYAMIGWAKREISDATSDVYGELYKFLNIDPEKPWLDTDSFEELTFDEDHPPPVPENLKPNLERVPFTLDVDSHKLVFSSRRFSPRMAQRAFDRLLNQPELQQEFGRVDVEMVISRKKIEEILKIPVKRRIEITLTVPNPDDLSTEEKRVLERLRRGNIRREYTEQTATRGESLQPDAETEAMIALSATNGRTVVKGSDAQGTPIEVSTSDHPYRRRYERASNQTDLDVVRNDATDFIERSQRTGKMSQT